MSQPKSPANKRTRMRPDPPRRTTPERLRMEETLEEQTQILDQIHDSVISTDLEGYVMTFNTGAERLYGYSRKEAIGRHISFIYPPEEHEYLQKNVIEPVKKKGRHEVQVRLRKKSGEDFISQLSLTLLKRKDGSLKGMIGYSSDITERKNMEEALRRSEQRSRNLVETTGDWVWEIDRNGVYTYASPRVQDLLGYAPEEVLGKTPFDFMPQAEAQRVGGIFEAIKDRGETFHGLENINRHKEGRLVVLETSGVPFFDEGNELLGYRGIDRNITERKRFEEKLQEERDFCKAILDTAGAIIVVLDPTGHILRFNWEAEKVTGFCSEEVTGKYFFDLLLAEEDREPVKEVFARLRSGNFPMKYENYWLTKSGDRRLISWSNTCVLNSSGEIIYLIGAGIDITDRKRMEEELRRSRDELELRVQERTAEICRQAELIDLAHDAIVVRDLDSVITFWNKGAEEIYGWTRKEAVGKVMRDLLQTQFPIPRHEIINTFMQEGRWEGELIQSRKDGQKVNVLSRWALQKDEEGRPISVMHINHDITQRLKLEDQLRQSQKMEAIGTLAGGIAHDFNNILATIVINSELGLFDLPRESGVRSNLDLILKSGMRGKDLVRQMLLFSRKSEKKQELVTLIPLIRETFKLLRSSIPTTVQMNLHLDTESDIISADPSQIQQVIMNLCANAAYALRGTMGSIDVFLEGITFGSTDLPEADMQPGNYLVLSVKDTGSGMDEEVRKRLFEPFFTTKPVGEGTGLGLSVVYGIVKSHKGNITVYSEPGKGSIFKVYLPKAEKATSLGAETIRPIPRGNERVLFVDDEEIIVTSVQNMLLHLGYKVTALLDSQGALKLFSENPYQFDLVITDQTMPFMTGEDLAKEFMRMRPDIPVILCTGYSDMVTSEKAAAMGFRGFIMKPFTVREGAELVRRVLDQGGSK